MILGQRIKHLREQNGLSQIELAQKLNISNSTLSQYESGTRAPSDDIKLKLASYFQVTVDYLLGASTKQFPTPNIANKIVTFPIIGEVAAGYEHIAMEDWSGDTISIPEEALRGRSRTDFFVLAVHGDSMYPDFREGDKVLVLKTSTLSRSGMIGVVLYDDDIATLKKVEYVQGKPWLKLVPINPMYPARTIEGSDLEHCRILGVPWLLLREYSEE